MRRLLLLAVLATVIPAGSASAATWRAGSCASLDGKRVGVKPVALGRALLVTDSGALLTRTGTTTTPGPDAEWPLAHTHLRRATGCRQYPEASLGARGNSHRGKVWGLVDAHLHITADLRAGGQVISGTPFARYGIPDALGRDAQVHGPDGSLDITGNLLHGGAADDPHDTHGWPTFTGWPARDSFTHQQIYWRWLQRAWKGGLRLVVAQTVEDQPLCAIEPRRSHSCDETATVGLEVAELHRLQNYVDAQSGGRGRGWLKIVTGPRQAAHVIRRGKLAVVLGVESSDVFGCSERLGVPACDRAQIDRGITHLRRLGIRSVFLAHWVDNALGGAALEGGGKGAFIGAMQLGQTGSPFSTGACPQRSQGTACNTRGLTGLGAYAVKRLMDAHMLIEADHLSEVGRERLLQLAVRRHYPLVSSHTGTGGAWTPSELHRLRRAGGFATATLDTASDLPAKVLALRKAMRGPVGIGSDTGGFASLPSSDATAGPLHYPFRSFDGRVTFTRERSGQRTFDFNKDGVAHYGLLPDLLAQTAREPQGRRALRVLFDSAGAYLRTWRRTGRR